MKANESEEIRVLLIGKFPPIQGGVASRSFWLAKGMENLGVRIAIVSDGFQAMEQGYCIAACGRSDAFPCNNISLTFLKGEIPWHIPNSPLNGERLFSLGLRVARSFKPHFIESNYLFPYGWAAHLLARRLSLPHLVRHGVSDVYRLSAVDELGMLSMEILAGASMIVTSKEFENTLVSMGASEENIALLSSYASSRGDAAPATSRETLEKPFRILYLGKVNYYWKRKGLEALVEMARSEGSPEILEIHFYGQGNGLGDYKEYVEDNGVEKFFKFRSFVPPWDVHGILSDVHAVFVCDEAPDVPTASNVVFEAVAVGTPIICNARVKDFAESHGFGHQCVLLDESCSSNLSQLVLRVNDCRKRSLPVDNMQLMFLNWIKENLNIYKRLMVADTPVRR